VTITTQSSARALAWHEAHHCSSLLLAGLTPLWCRIDLPTPGLRGSVGVDWARWGVADDTLYAVLVATCQGPASDGELRSAWPIVLADWDGTGSRQDGQQIQYLTQCLGIDSVGWHGLLFQVNKQSRDPAFRRLVVEIASELERVEVLLRPELEALAARVSQWTHA
jgi:hypothetical protein